MVDFYFIVMVEGVLYLLSVIFDVNELIQYIIWLILFRSVLISICVYNEGKLYFFLFCLKKLFNYFVQKIY